MKFMQKTGLFLTKKRGSETTFYSPIAVQGLEGCFDILEGIY
jgi:hypothetical protein